MPSIGDWAYTACLWEVTAPKAGDATPNHDLGTLRCEHFLASAAAFAPILNDAPRNSVGQTVLEAVRAMRRVVAGNPHLGTILLLAPLAAVPADAELRSGLPALLAGLSIDDARIVYEAIRLAQPSGLGQAAEQDVASVPTQTLREVMTLAADRDLVARQYANNFQEVFNVGVPALASEMDRTGRLEAAICFCQLRMLDANPDSLIARKLGMDEAVDASRRARAVLDHGWPHTDAARTAWQELDGWMRAKPGRNPGTTADLVCASLFVALRTGFLSLPSPFPPESMFGR
ncbi:MAG: triphosphoribosyl-dephospho-CoA synthase [Gemmataceae bacterium]|nr:triphosphoribosyl-dephospho-CoA synthase [Gemmataceae bacterium]